MIVSILSRGKPLVWGTIVLFVLLLSGCGIGLPPEERARLRAERETIQLEKALARIYPIGKEENRRLSKEEAYIACNQKSKSAADLAARQFKREQEQMDKITKSSGGFFGGVASAMEARDQRDSVYESTINSCLIDFGYMRR